MVMGAAISTSNDLILLEIALPFAHLSLIIR